MKTIKMSKKHFDEIKNTSGYYGPRYTYWYKETVSETCMVCKRIDCLGGIYRGFDHVFVEKEVI